MNLRTYSIIMTGIAVASLGTLCMWGLTTCDVLSIMLFDILVAVVTACLVASSDGWCGEITDYKHFKKTKDKERKLYIYDIR